MKKIIIALLIFIPSISQATIDTNLKYGSQGQPVIELQEFLINKGFLIGSATGNFYSLTKKAVIAYQTSIGLPATGFVGPMTREKINPELVINNTSEIQETGVVSDPISTPSIDASLLQNQIKLLQQQVAQLLEQQKTQATQTSQTNQYLQQIQQNTNPIPAPVISPKIDLSSVTIFSPIAGKGLSKRVDPITGQEVGFRVSPTYPEIQDESNYIVLGLICRNQDGNAVLKYDVNVEATDSSQNKFIRGTGTDQLGIGSVATFYKNGAPETVSYYGFNYEFKTAGQHTIKFTCNGMSDSITLNVN